MSTAKSRYRSDEVRRIGPNDSDPFGHRDYADAIVRALDDFPPRFTLGLFGPWGSGKSTILDEVGRQLQDESPAKTAFVMFDAWRFEGDSLRRELIREVGNCLKRQEALRKGFDFEKHTEIFDVDTTTSRRPGLKLEWGSIQNGVVAAVLAVLAVVAFLLLVPKLGASKTTTLQFLVAIAGALTTFTLVALRQVVVPEPVQMTRRRLEFPDEFAASFKTLLDNVSVERLVIAIDNLDRCSPARVTEILSSVKTFLEPALEETGSKRDLKSLHFIVAADDAALRRHLTAQELGHSADGSAPDKDKSLPEEVRNAVNEYLRKFFGASMRIQELLDEDVRTFTEEEIESFVQARNVDDKLRKELIEMTSQALKRNPRRIKQFVNNLQLRLEMLEARKAQERIHVEIDARVVAKLAIIEEEFPGKFERLQQEPSLLRTWHDQARSSDSACESLDQALVNFLRFTDDIQPRDIRAYLRLKQTRAELELPRYTEFVDLLDDGNVEKLRALLSEEQGDEAKYAEAASRHFAEERGEDAWGRAHNTLRSVVEVPLLHGSEGNLFKRTLRSAMRRPPLRERLTQLAPIVLLEAAVRHDLPPNELRQLIGVLVSGMGPEQSSEVRYEIAEALTQHLPQIDGTLQERISRTLGAEGVRSDLDSYVPLAEALPKVLDDETLDIALDRIEETAEADALRASSAYRIALAMLRQRDDAERLDRFLQLVRPVLDAQLGSGSVELSALAEDLADVLDDAEETPMVNELSVWLSSNLEGLLPDRQILELGFNLCKSSPSADAGAGAALASWLFDHKDGDGTVAWLTERFEQLPPEFAKKARGLVAEAMAGQSASLSPPQAEELAALYGKEQQAEMRREAVAKAIADGRPEAARSLLAKLGEGERKALLADALSAVEDSARSHLGEAAFLVDQRAMLGEEQLFDLAMLLAKAAYEHRDAVLAVSPLIGKVELDDPSLRQQLVAYLLDTEADMADASNRAAVLEAASNVAREDDDTRAAVVARLEDLQQNE